jgi:hypothetical protein
MDYWRCENNKMTDSYKMTDSQKTTRRKSVMFHFINILRFGCPIKIALELSQGMVIS